ncbi:VCBS repeat-containing protein [bacterium]|nr:VCBS repeat-containing protein [bacterium]
MKIFDIFLNFFILLSIKGSKRFLSYYAIGLIISLITLSSAKAKEVNFYDHKYLDLKYQGDSLSSPTVVDLNDDGIIDLIIIGTLQGNIYAWDTKGNLYQGYPLTIADEIRGKVYCIDINNDLKKELVVATLSGYIITLNISGEKLWIGQGGGEIIKGITIDDVDEDGIMEILVPLASKRSGCLAIDGVSHKEKWFFPSSLQSNLPQVGDVDGDGQKEIICSGIDNLYCLNNQGQLLWKKYIGSNLNETLESCQPALSDVDGDGKLEVIMVANNKLIILDGKGKEILQISYGSSRLNKSINPPLVIDLNKDGKNEVVWADCSNNFYAFSMDKKIIPGFPIYTLSTIGDHFHTTPVVLDLIGDNDLEVILTSMDGYVYLMKYDRIGKSLKMLDSVRLPHLDNFKKSPLNVNPLIYDLDGDNDHELLVNYQEGVAIWSFPKKRAAKIFIEERKSTFEKRR